jgi:hypothetical protein
MIATGRPFAAEHRSQCGRNFRIRTWRVNVEYDWEKPSTTTSSNNVIAHRCGSSTNRSRQKSTNGSNGLTPAATRTPAVRVPFR